MEAKQMILISMLSRTFQCDMNECSTGLGNVHVYAYDDEIVYGVC